MAISINDLDDDDILYQQQEPDNTVTQNPDSDDTFMLDFLKSKGIEDPSKIKFEDEQGNIQERDWNSLSREEQINILNTPLDIQNEKDDDNVEYSDEEIDLLNKIRESGLTPSQYIDSLQKNDIVQEPIYKIDDLSDDELYILDLESRVGELTDDQAVQALSIAKQNEELYKKQTEGIRKEYKEREDYNIQKEQAELEQQQQEAYENYKNAIADAITDFNSIGNLDLNFDDKDREELASFMLSQDENGNNYLYEALQDPETLVKVAWFILNGAEAFDTVTEYFTNQIKLISRNQHNTPDKPQVVIDDNKKNVRHRVYKSIEDLDDDD